MTESKKKLERRVVGYVPAELKEKLRQEWLRRLQKDPNATISGIIEEALMAQDWAKKK